MGNHHIPLETEKEIRERASRKRVQSHISEWNGVLYGTPVFSLSPEDRRQRNRALQQINNLARNKR